MIADMIEWYELLCLNLPADAREVASSSASGLPPPWLFDGILFKSVQNSTGTNVVLFSKAGHYQSSAAAFDFEYVENSLRFSTSTEVRYVHQDEPFFLDKKRQLVFHRDLPMVDLDEE